MEEYKQKEIKHYDKLAAEWQKSNSGKQMANRDIEMINKYGVTILYTSGILVCRQRNHLKVVLPGIS